MTMNTRPSIMLVEDDDFEAKLTIGIIAADYSVQHFSNGESALSKLEEMMPDLVLLDVLMPGLSGYDVCRSLRENQATCDVPVIFISGLVDEEDLLAGYEAGGDDYLTKPVKPGELRLKMSRAISRVTESSRHKSDYSNAFSTAMTAMTSAGEVGSVLKFMRASFNCPDYIALCREVLSTIAAYGLEASIQIRGKGEIVSLNHEGRCSPLEEAVLGNMSTHGRIFEFSSRTSFSHEHITIIIKNMPKDDPDRAGRMKDNLALLTEGANARVITLDDQLALTKQKDALMKLITDTRETLGDIDKHQQSQHEKTKNIYRVFLDTLERKYIHLGLKYTQEEELSEFAQETINSALALLAAGDERMKKLLMQLDDASDL